MKTELIYPMALGFIFIFSGIVALIVNKFACKNSFKYERPANGPIPPGSKILVRSVAGIKQGSEIFIGGQWLKVTRRFGNTLWVKPAEKIATSG